MSSGPAARGQEVFDLWGAERPRNAPPLPRLLAASVRLAWQAGRRELTVMFAMQFATVVLVVADLLLARSLVADLVDAERTGGTIGGLGPEVVGIAVVTAAIGVANAVQLHRQRILTEVCARFAEDRVLAVTSSVELAAFDEPRFHDAVERALLAVRRLPAVVTSLSGLLRALAGAVGAVVGLVAIAPLFAPIMLLVGVPTWLAARRRGRAFYGFAHRLTPRDRERRYLAETLGDRDAA
ncbi:MAG: ATP-binding cassette, subfamily bacterial, partial [Thermoleophilaceae bacterium]|nr:ATP-binding cassette, subfamily bacterial [Thermoleophilaceae bacterium]